MTETDPQRRRGGPTARLLAACLIFGGTVTVASAESACPAFLETSKQLLVVTTTGMDAMRARLRRFVRDGEGNAWRALGPAEPAVVGKSGLAWGHPFRALARPGEPVKAEGDRRTPAGLYRIGESFGVAVSRRSGHRVLRPGETLCVDDPASPAYNAIAPRRSLPQGTRGEDMGAEPLYRRGLVVDYPSDRASRAGSCIFLHVWRGAAAGTAGCIALPEARVAALQRFLTPDASVIAILPEGTGDRFGGCLPRTAP